MIYEEHNPPDQLRRYIKCFWKLEHDYSREPFKEGEHIWPDGHLELIFCYGETYLQKTSSGWKALPKQFLIGQFKTELLLKSYGITGLNGVRFHAWGPYPFLNLPMSIYTNKITDSSAIARGIFRQLSEDMQKNKDRGITLLQDFFVRSITSIVHQSHVEPIAREIHEKNGVVQIRDLVQAFYTNGRRMQRLFDTEVGIPAKLFAKIIRFNRAKKMIEKDPNINLAEVAYASGYADQSHFIRNFRSLYGITPRQFREKVSFLRRFFLDNDHVVFVQDNKNNG